MKRYLLLSCVSVPGFKGETGKEVNFSNIFEDDLSVALYQILPSQAVGEQEI